MSETFTTTAGRQLAYNKTEGTGPGVVFLGGFKSDKEGTKAIFLEDWAKETGRAFLRFEVQGQVVAWRSRALGGENDRRLGVVRALQDGHDRFVDSRITTP